MRIRPLCLSGGFHCTLIRANRRRGRRIARVPGIPRPFSALSFLFAPKAYCRRRRPPPSIHSPAAATLPASLRGGIVRKSPFSDHRPRAGDGPQIFASAAEAGLGEEEGRKGEEGKGGKRH